MKSVPPFCLVLLIVVGVSSHGGVGLNRVINGDTAVVAQFPFMASLRTSGNVHFCGGWFPNGGANRWLVTSAHCVRDRLPADIVAHMGTNSRTADGVVHAIEQIVIHPDYNANLVANNIALIRTAAPIVPTGLVQSIGINLGNIAGGVPVIIPGWGLTSVGELKSFFHIPSKSMTLLQRPGNFSDDLLFASVSTITREQCLTQHTNLNRRYIYESTICTDNENSGMCTGDAGGPLVTGEIPNRVVVGMVSWNMPCGTGTPDVAVRISDYVQWINSNTVP